MSSEVTSSYKFLKDFSEKPAVVKSETTIQLKEAKKEDKKPE